MEVFIGIDLGSTTSKAVVIDNKKRILGKGITNTRADYEVATELSRREALFDAQFNIMQEKLKEKFAGMDVPYEGALNLLKKTFYYVRFRKRLYELRDKMMETAEGYLRSMGVDNEDIASVKEHLSCMVEGADRGYLADDKTHKSPFFRDIVSEYFNEYAERVLPRNLYEWAMVCFDKSMTAVENKLFQEEFADNLEEAFELIMEKGEELFSYGVDVSGKSFTAELELLSGDYTGIPVSFRRIVEDSAKTSLVVRGMVGTGYGRALLPFPEKFIRSEILCHAKGAHFYFPGTRTVLDIGGQDTKAIQVDENGMVTNFFMNDRCAAGCGRYLGYVADEMGLPVSAIGDMALRAKYPTPICSTCTVFAGAEIRDLLHAGEKRENILSGLHRAIVLRAMSLLARAGGVRNELTFTGGVAKNPAVVKYVIEMVHKNYGEHIKINIHPDSIYMGALGGALFALQESYAGASA